MIAEAFASLIPQRRAYRNASLENPSYSLDDPALYDLLTGGHKSASGITVTHEGSLALAAVWQAISLISGDGAKMPVYPYKRLPDNDREIADKHQSYIPVALRANQWKSAKRFWADLIVHMLLWGNGYAFINRSGPLLELYNLLPDRTAPKWVKVPTATGYRAELIYETEVDGHLETVLPRNILHVRKWSVDGIKAPDLVVSARDAWGLALSAQNFESKFFKNGARIGGILELPVMSKPARDTVEEGFRTSYEGGDNPFRTVILREGAKFHAGQVNPREGQVVELKDSQKREIASYFNVPPSLLGIRDSQSYNSFEQDRLNYLHGCLHHVCDAISDECDAKLLTEQEWIGDGYFFEHNYSEFITADWASLTEGLRTLREAEFINSNEGRRKLNLPRRKDPGGEEYLNPNTRSADSQGSEGKPPPKKPERKAHRDLFVDTFARMARRVGFDVRQASGDAAKFLKWLDGNAADHRNVFSDAVRPVAAAYCEVFGGTAEALCAAAATEFFDGPHAGGLLGEMQRWTQPPNSAEDLKANVDRGMNYFERFAPKRVANKILEEPCLSTE